MTVWERLAAKFAIARAKFQTGEDLRQSNDRLGTAVRAGTEELIKINAALRESEERFQQMATNIREVFWLADAETPRVLYVSPAFESIWGRSRKALYENSLVWFDAVHPEDRNEAHRVLFSNRESEAPRSLEYRIVRPDGGVRWISDHAFPVRDGAGRVYRLAGVAHDITKRMQTEAALVEREAALRRANRALRVLKECDEALLRATNEAELLAPVCRIVVESGGARMAWVGFPENDAKKTVRPMASAGDGIDYLKNARIEWADTALGRGPTGSAIRNREVNICYDVATDPRMKPWRKEQLQRGYAASIALPLLWEDRCMGALTIYSPERDAFNDEEIELFKQLAGDLTFGLISLRTRTEREQLQFDLLKIAEREKQLISQELHDGLCQNLTGTCLMANLLQRRLAARGDEYAEEARQICNLLNTSTNEARNLSHGLHPIGPDGEGLMSALSTLAGTVTNLFHLRCTFHCPEPVILENETAATHLLRIAQEAINNARKHGQAGEIAIGLLNTPQGIELAIEDNGVGIPRTLPKKRGLGLKTMNYRASEIGATLTLRRAGKKGTIVTCVLPVSETACDLPAEPEKL